MSIIRELLYGRHSRRLVVVAHLMQLEMGMVGVKVFAMMLCYPATSTAISALQPFAVIRSSGVNQACLNFLPVKRNESHTEYVDECQLQVAPRGVGYIFNENEFRPIKNQECKSIVV